MRKDFADSNPLRALLAAALAAAWPAPGRAVDLADSPLFSGVSVPGNVVLALSVEWPTATTPAYPSTTAYARSATFLGYFDPEKCYLYVPVNSGSAAAPNFSGSYFRPYGAASGHTCRSTAATPLWSGNYLNWAATQTLDAFRWVLTGGYRSTDSATTTVLTKTYAASDTPTVVPEKTVATTELDGATPFASAKWTSGAVSRIRNLGTRLWISGGIPAGGTPPDGLVGGSATTGALPYTGQSSMAAPATASYAQPNRTYEVFVNVKVCDITAGLEGNCVRYGSAYKPEGLMQRYSSQLRFSAFGYYNHSGDATQQRDGGVMRARMKYIGPSQPVPGSSAISNSHAEWDGLTGVMNTNPDPADASATVSLAAASGWSVPIVDSGVMNYLNKFGNFAKSYKSKDPVSELYYAALRYYRNLGNVSTYTTLSSAGNAATASQWLDGFPAITGDDVWKKNHNDADAPYGSPILYSCQKNFVLGIGDVNTHRDANLPGSVLRSSLEPTVPSQVLADTEVDVKASTDMVGQLEGVSGGLSQGSVYGDSGNGVCGSTAQQCNTYYIAGLAYDAHTRDLRADISGRQTVSTYWMDVLEKQVYKHKNPYWLAAKYGGFDVPVNFSPMSPGNGPTTLGDKSWHNNADALAIGTPALTYSTDTGSSDKRPDNYFTGDRPETMKSGLAAAFAKIVSETNASTASAFSMASPNVTGDNGISYSSTYNPQNWSGELIASRIAYDKNGAPTATALWDARDVLERMLAGPDTSARKIVTCCTTGGKALPFTSAALSTTPLNARTNYGSFSHVPGVLSQSSANFVAYLRGASSQEIANGGVYRTRAYRLGDIVNSKPTVVSAPGMSYRDSENPGYSAFSKGRSARRTVVYAGANDGMLHAFDGTTGGASSGKELFAYVPSFVYGDSASAAVSGLAALGNPSYVHHYYVDATAQVFDVDLARTAGAAAGSSAWRSLLIGGLGKGGNGYFAIDVTDPDSWSSEDAVAQKVLWEFTDNRMGLSFGAPAVVKTRKYGWVAVFSAGYNNPDGKGWFFFVNPATGSLLEAVSTTEGSPGAPLNMAQITAFVPDYGNFTSDAVYGADLQGNVWRLDVSGSAFGTPVKIATLKDSRGTPQPVTKAPLVEIDPVTKRRYVMVGTGRLLDDSDIANGDGQSLYAIVDGTGAFGDFSRSGASGSSFPYTRAMLQANDNPLAGLGNSSSPLGWYFDLSTAGGVAERIDVDMTANNGVIAFAANRPSGDTCSPSGTGRTLALGLSSGKTVLTDAAGNLVVSSSAGSEVRELAFQRVMGKLRLYTGDSSGGVQKVPAALGGAGPLRQISWREIRITP